ncbi:MAG: crossover junction endodeoxyribonuclease RuvC [Planctomycetaceae bacterium]|nr:crossover junction endodeoxyribonuclease RuvC [Planctomycetaceae bacterium]
MPASVATTRADEKRTLVNSHAAQRAATPVLGVDPGLNRTGYAILDRGTRGPILREAGVIRSTAKMPLAERVLEIGQGLREVCEQYRPKVMAIEQVFSTGQFPKTALLMAHARGAILYAAADCQVHVVHYTPRQIKKLLTGSGKAGKEQVQRAIANELRLDRLLEPHDVSDAAAVALCHYYSVRIPNP